MSKNIVIKSVKTVHSIKIGKVNSTTIQFHLDPNTHPKRQKMLVPSWVKLPSGFEGVGVIDMNSDNKEIIMIPESSINHFIIESDDLYKTIAEDVGSVYAMPTAPKPVAEVAVEVKRRGRPPKRTD